MLYEDNPKLIAFDKNKIIEDLKMIMDKLYPIENARSY